MKSNRGDEAKCGLANIFELENFALECDADEDNENNKTNKSNHTWDVTNVEKFPDSDCGNNDKHTFLPSSNCNNNNCALLSSHNNSIINNDSKPTFCNYDTINNDTRTNSHNSDLNCNNAIECTHLAVSECDVPDNNIANDYTLKDFVT